MNMPLPVAMGVWIGLALLCLAALFVGWRAARRRDADIPAPPPAPAGPLTNEPIVGKYLATTRSGRRLVGIGAHGLGDRSAALIHILPAGVLVERPGAPTLYIPAAAIRGVSLAAGMAGRVVRSSRVVIITWSLPPLVDTGLLPALASDAAALRDGVTRLMETP